MESLYAEYLEKYGEIILPVGIFTLGFTALFAAQAKHFT